jgi:CotH kinase protein
MKNLSIIILLFASTYLAKAQTSTALFAEDTIASIYLTINADSLAQMYTQYWADIEHPTLFIYDDGTHRDTLQDVALRLRGNTSRNAGKKSFKISFNDYQAGRRYQGVKELNLNAQHNDPTLIREKLYYDTWNAFGLPKRRANFVKLYINGTYYGLYTNMEEMDKIWLARNFANSTGNLYKCTYPADLKFIDTTQQAYKNVQSGTVTGGRAYNLQTNKLADNYSDLVAFITAINSGMLVFQQNITPILNVETMLKALAIDVATGHWDDYAYNKNNYFLYKNPITQQMEFIAYDTDNTFGVDWVGVDWANRSYINWGKPTMPLSTKLLQIPAYFDLYKRYVNDSLANNLLKPANVFPHIDAIQNFIRPDVYADVYYRGLDWGYSDFEFENGFIGTIDGHTPYGIKPFLQRRFNIKTVATDNNLPIKDAVFTTQPNPAHDFCSIVAPEPITTPLYIYDALGRMVRMVPAPNSAVFDIDLMGLVAGIYFIQNKNFAKMAKIVVF